MVGLKKNTLTVGGVVVLVLSVIAFVFIPASVGPMDGGTKMVLGKWKKKVLDNTPDGLFFNEYRRLHRTMEMFGYFESENAFERQARENRAMRIAFDASMVQLAAQQEVVSAGFLLSNKAINKELLYFYTDPATGSYSDQLYKQTSEQQRLSNRRSVIDGLTARRYFEDLYGSTDELFGLKTSSAEIAFVQKMAEKERTFRYVVFDENQFPKDKIKVYGEEHADLFAEHSLTMLTFTSKEEAEKIAAVIQKGELKFEDAVVTHSTKRGTDETGKLLSPYRTAVNQTFPESHDLDIVLKLPVNEISPVVKITGGYALVKCTAPVKPADFNLEETEDRVFSYMQVNERSLIEDYLEDKAKLFIQAVKTDNTEDGFTRTAEKDNLVVQTSNPFVINYGNADMLPQISSQSDSFFIAGARNETFLKKAFALKPLEISEPLRLGSNILVMQLEEERDGKEETINNIGTMYNQYASFWDYNYPLAELAFRPLSWGQQTLLDFIRNSKNYTDNFDKLSQK